jgi:hypothetical protein
MTLNDLIIATPWIIFGAALCAVGIRLLAGRRAGGPGPASSGAAHPAEPNAGQETMRSRQMQEGQRPEKTECRSR